jgi:two-component system chemotaxis response regulator CheY
MDNSRTIRALVRDCALDLGYDCVEAEHGKEGLELLPSIQDLGLVVLDWRMPVMSGRETLRRLREDEARTDIPVLLLIPIEQRDQVMDAIAQGGTNYLFKPFRVNELQDMMEQLMSNAV